MMIITKFLFHVLFKQAVLIVSGNLSFLNWLTMLPSIFCFDDYMLSWLFSKASVKKVIGLQRERKEGVERPPGEECNMDNH